jgi:hypothetical protein
MIWTSYLPSSPASLTKIEWWLWFFAGFFIILSVFLGFAARSVNQYKAHILQKQINNLSPRHLKDKEIELLSLEFTKLKNTEIIICHPNDTETSIFAQKIKEIMLSSGIIAKRFVCVSGPLPQGIFISAGFPKTTQDILSTAFTSIGITTYI